MKRILLALILLAAPAERVLACPQAFFGYGYSQAYYAAPAQYYAQAQYYAPQQYAQASSVEAEIAALELRIQQLRASFSAQYSRQQTAYYSAPLAVVEQPVYVRQLALRRRNVLAAEVHRDFRPVERLLNGVGRALDFVLPDRRPPVRQRQRQRHH